jgi:hypothetical protein
MTGSIRLAAAAYAAATAVAAAAAPAAAQRVRVAEQLYLPAAHNWTFRSMYPAADRLFNAFDYGHAILYEVLLTRPRDAVDRLEGREYDYLTQRLLPRPPRLPVAERAIMPTYARLVPEAKMMFEWAHVLHRQVYDVLADESLSMGEKDDAIAAVLRYYRSRPDLAFSTLPKTMELMEEQYYGTAFREAFPKFNGLIWAYHWLQVALYEPLLTGAGPEARRRGVNAAVARFWQMLEDPPAGLPHVMPMTAAVAPAFAERYPEVAIIFDNLHSMHDVVSDILASPAVPRSRKRAEILLAAERYRDDDSFVMTREEWRAMSVAMGVENMGGPAVGFVTALPVPTVRRGATMREMHGAQDHVAEATAADAHAAHRAADPHAGHGPAEADALPGALDADATADLLVRLLSDATIRARIAADAVLVRLVRELAGQAAAAHRAHIGMLLQLLESAGHERHEGGDAAHAR